MSARKRQQTMAKFQREQAVKEKRARKQQKKLDAALAKAEGASPAVDLDAGESEGAGAAPDET
jgi:hypothetical protein